MRLQVLHVPDCPHAAVMVARLVQLLGNPAKVEQRVIRDQDGAAALGMQGSPTLLIDGIDPFRVAGHLPSLSCRLYLDENGSLAGAPSLQQLRQALASAGPDQV